ncbi:hypothetical protein WA026_023190 [Henosepilachna vigintioctopunctata]|uniref:Uncharacterized protein n=1 Tax=Henosepilachna vigintioctopunctata TaxID=420089 RepID=A0AAW1UQH4_9CUCU
MKMHLDQIIRVLDNSKIDDMECVGGKGDFSEPKKLTIQQSPLIDDKFVVDKNMIVNSDVKQDVLEKDRYNLENRDVTIGNNADVEIRDKGTELPKELSPKRERPKRNVKPPDRLNL